MNQSGGLTINNTRLKLDFLVTISEVPFQNHPIRDTSQQEEGVIDTTDNTDGGNGVTSGGRGVGVDFEDPLFKDKDPEL